MFLFRLFTKSDALSGGAAAFGAGKALVNYLRNKCGESFSRTMGIASEMRRALHYRCPKRETACLLSAGSSVDVF